MEQNQSVSTSAASDFVALGLNQASTYFEKLTLFARLRDEVTGRYSDPLAVPVNGKPSDALLEQLHWQVFCWVASSRFGSPNNGIGTVPCHYPALSSPTRPKRETTRP